MTPHRDAPIVAIATPAGRGGIGVVRVSFGRWTGHARVAAFVATLCRKPDDYRLVPRHATLVGLHAADGAVIDRGIQPLITPPPPADLSHAGAVVDKAIEYMAGQNLSPLSIASALLGGSLGLLARTMGDDAIAQVLQNAMSSVRSGELRAEYGPHEGTSGRA